MRPREPDARDGILRRGCGGCRLRINMSTLYNKHFNLTQAPFSITPDPRFLYMSQRHQEALAHLLYGTGEDGGFVQLTGEVGTGKTTLVRALLESHLERVDVALILNPRLTVEEFVASTCDELGVHYGNGVSTLKPMIDALNQHLLATHVAGRQTVLIVDEAQNLTVEVLEQVRLLTNLETSRHKLLRIILVGQPELQLALERHDLRQLAQRITARYHLTPLSRSDVGGYIAHRLRVAGGRPDLFTEASVRAVHKRSGGVPRLINVICDRAMLGAYAEGASHIDRRTVVRASAEVGGRSAAARIPAGLKTAAAVAAVVILTAGLAAIYRWYDPQPAELLAGLRGRWLPVDSKAVPTGVPSDPRYVDVESQFPTVAVDLNQPAIRIVGNPEQTVIPPASSELAAIPTVVTDTGERSVEARSEAGQPRIGDSLRGIRVAGEVLLGSAGLDMTAAQPIPVIADLPVELLLDLALTKVPRELLHRVWGAPANAAPCQQGAVGSLHCFQGWTDWDELLDWNRPALVTLQATDNLARDVLLLGVEGDQALVDLGTGRHTVAVAQLRALWNGQVTVLWRSPVDTALILQGGRGDPVRWLRQQLDLAEGISIDANTASDRFDAELGVRVRRFQAHHGLVADGVVGPRTMLYLDQPPSTPNSPTLSSNDAVTG